MTPPSLGFAACALFCFSQLFAHPAYEAIAKSRINFWARAEELPPGAIRRLATSERTGAAMELAFTANGKKIVAARTSSVKGAAMSETKTRRGPADPFADDETLKSNLILEAELLAAQQQPDAAADRFAKAAAIEERLAARCAERGLTQKKWLHLFSAASCWSRAGDFHTAIGIAEQLPADADLPPRLRERVEDFVASIRRRRSEWSAGLALSSTSE